MFYSFVGGYGTCRKSGKWLNCSEVYDVLNGTWSDGPSSPYAIEFPIATTHQNASFALIIVRNNPKTTIIIFDAENGFDKVFPTNFDLDYYLVTASIQ